MLNIQNVLRRLRPVSMLLLVYIVGCAPIYTENTDYPIGTGGDYPIGTGVGGGVASQQSEIHTRSSTTYVPTPIFISPDDEFGYRRHYYSPHYYSPYYSPYYYTNEPRVRKMRKAKKSRNRARAKKRKTATSAKQDQTLPKHAPKQAIGQKPAFSINQKPSKNAPQVIENRQPALPINTPKQKYNSKIRKQVQSRQVSPQPVRRAQPARRAAPTRRARRAKRRN
ncbi:hypothetical protein QUF54_10560 [Candidatus Marithioploca araucensis]|uniref:Lipoprotein n=1 Tax=Candidatus Marithioploca araucensis TaxID=70273 RepID=A0ABT7VW27_9GAMM|nr:hypothetical protein [Candidatus Marithioploca araucensis]